MKIKSYGKINLILEVGHLRADKFHEIKSIVQTISLSDNISIEVNNTGKIEMNCSIKSIPCDERNTVFRAIKQFFEEFKIDKGMSVFLEKNIPFEAGLGGGSGNAGAILLALNKIFETNKDIYELSKMGAKIGSDVPLFLFGGTIFMSGRGEIIKPLEDFNKIYLNVVKHKNIGVSTKLAYEELDKRENLFFNEDSESFLENLNNLNFTNDFHLPLLKMHNELKSVHTYIMDSGAKCALLSGSGSSIFGYYLSEEERDAGFNNLIKKRNINVFSCESINRNEYKNSILGDLS